MKESQDAARAEARIWLAMRATPWPQYYHHDILPEDNMKIVYANIMEINKACYQRDPNVIKSVSKDILDRLIGERVMPAFG